MLRSFPLRRGLTAAALVLGLTLSLVAQEPQDRAAAWLGVAPEQLADIEVVTKEFPAQGLVVTAIKALDRGTDEVVSAARDQFGRRADLSALVRQEKALRQSVPALRITSDVREALEGLATNETLPIALWLVMDHMSIARYQAELFDGVELSTEEAEAREESAGRFAQSRVAEVVTPMSAALRELGLSVRYASIAAPVIFTDATKAQIEALSEIGAIDGIYLERSDYADTNVDANGTHRTDRVHHYGIRGRGVDVAMLENNGVDPACPHLNITDWFNAGSPNPDQHIHGTSGCVASQLVSRLGASPDVRLYSANAASYSDSNVMAASDWAALTASVDMTNMSYGGNYSGAERLMDRYYDYMVRTYQDCWIASAGNEGLGDWVGSPGTAYNVITVGSFDDEENKDWNDDNMSSFSSTRNPASGCEKPNLAANGENVDTLGDAANNWLTNGYDGTSFSAPHATGNLANAMSVDSTLNLSPEASMAAIMATAWHNIEGASRLSDEDGAGGLHGLALYRLAADGRADYRNVTTSSFNNNGYFTYDIYLQGGDRTRVAIAWSTLANSTYTTTTLEADLDLRVYEGQGVTSGTSYGSSASFNNNFEIVEFTPVRTGWYTIRVNDYRFDGTSERLGMAWSQKWEDTSYARMREAGNDEIQPTTGPTIGTNSYDMDIADSASPGAFYGVFASGTRANGYGIDAHLWSPLDVDFWTQLQLMGDPSWVNMSGLLDSSGRSTAPLLRIQPVPVIVGYPLQHVFVTITGSGAVKEISEIHRFHFWPARTVLTLADDATTEVQLPFSFPFYGNNYTSVWVNSNGNLTFGSGDTDFSESEAELLADQPRIALCWDDLEPDEPGSLGSSEIGYRLVNQGEQHVVIEFSDVGEYQSAAGADGQNSFRAILWASGRIELCYNDCSMEDGIVGISPGGGLSTNSEINFGSFGNYSSSGAIFEQFTAGADSLDLDSSVYWNKVIFTPNRTATNYTLSLDVE